MSHRGNLVLADENGYTVRKCHCALALLQLMFWGPQFAINYILDITESDDWNHIVEDEGSVLIDLSKRKILFYGGEYIQLHVPRLRLYIELMKHVWTGWTVGWADRGVFDLADYVNYPRSKVDYIDYSRYVQSEDFLIDSLNPDETWHDGIISVKFLDGQIRVQQASSFFDILTLGKKLIEHVWNNSSLSQLKWHSDEHELPCCGIHIDKPTKILYFWSAYPIGNMDFLEPWNDWEVIWLKNNFDEHLRLTEKHIKLDIPSQEALLAQLRAYLLVEMTYAEHVEKYGHFSATSIISHNVKIPYYAVKIVDKLPSVEERTKTFNEAVEAWRASQS